MTNKSNSLKSIARGVVAGAVCMMTVGAAQAFPDKPIRMIVPFGAGGLTDTAARVTADQLSKKLGVDIVVVNKGGGGGTIGAAEAAKAKADGHTILFSPYAPIANQIHLRKVPYNIESFDFVCHTFYAPYLVYVKPDSEYDSLGELMDAAKADPESLSWASPAVGSFPHLAGAYFDSLLGGNVLTHVGGAGDAKATPMLLGGHLTMMFASPSVAGLKDAKKLASLTDERLPILPDLPTAKELGYDVQVGVGGGIVAPAGLDPEIRAALGSSCGAVVESAEYSDSMEKLGIPAVFKDGDEYEAFIREMSASNGALFESMGLSAK